MGGGCGSGPREDAGGVVATGDGGCEVKDVAVDEAASVKVGGDSRAAFDEQLQHVFAAESVEQLLGLTRPFGAGVDLRSGRCGAENDAPGRGSLCVADGEGRVVGPNGPRADENRVAFGTQFVHTLTCNLTRDPSTRSVGRGCSSVECARHLQHDPRTPRHAVVKVRGQLCAHEGRARTDVDGDAGGAEFRDTASRDFRIGVDDTNDDA